MGSLQEPYWTIGQAFIWIKTRDETKAEAVPRDKRHDLLHHIIEAAYNHFIEASNMKPDDKIIRALTDKCRSGSIRTRARNRRVRHLRIYRQLTGVT